MFHRTSRNRYHKLIGLGAVGALLITAGCGNNSADTDAQSGSTITIPKEKSGTLTFLTKWPDPDQAPFFKSVANAYMKKYPNVKVKVQAVGDQPYKDKIQVLTSSNNLPDIYFAWAGEYSNKFARAGYAADLSSVLGPNTSWGKSFSQTALKAYNYEGKQYGVPIDLDAKLFAYSKPAFKKAGVTAPPESYGQLLSDCGKLKRKGYTPIAFGNQFGWPAIHYITQLNAMEVPKDVRDKDYNPASGKFTDPGYVKAIKDFKKIIDTCSKPGSNGVPHNTALGELTNGKAAMQYVEAVEVPDLTAKGVPAQFKKSWGFFSMPPIKGAAGDQKVLAGAPNGFLINSKSKHVGLAVDFMKFFTNKANATKETKELGWLSPVNGSLPSDAVKQNKEAKKLIDNASEFAIWLDTETDSGVAQAYLSGMEGLLDNKLTPKQIMKGVQKAAAKAAKEQS